MTVTKKIIFDYNLYFWNSVHGWERTAFVVVVDGSDDAVTHDANHLAKTKWCIKRNRFVFLFFGALLQVLKAM